MREPKKKLTKKQRAEIAKTQQKKKHSQQSQQKEKKYSFPLNTVIGVSFFSFGTILLVGIFVILTFFFQAPKSLSELLPSDRTLGFIEMKILGKNFKDLFQKLGAYEAYNIRSLESHLTETSGLEYDTHFQPWVGERLGIAFLLDDTKIYNIFFVQTRNKKKSLSTLLPASQGSEIKNLSFFPTSKKSDFFFTLLDRYVVFGQKDALEFFTKFTNENESLKNNSSYIKISNNLVSQNPIFGYLNFRLFLSYLLQSDLIPLNLSDTLSQAQDFFNIFSVMGLSATYNGKSIVAQTFLDIDKQSLKENTYYRFKEKYLGQLLNFIPQSNLAFLHGGHNLEAEWHRTVEILNDLYPSASLISEAILEAQKDIYFGNEISLENDIFPLLKGEYALSIHEKSNGKSFLALISLNNVEKDRERIEKLQQAFLSHASQPSSKILEVVNDDSSTGKEVIVRVEDVEKEKNNYKNIPFSVFSFNDSNVYTALFGSYFLLSNDLLTFQSTLDALKGENFASLTSNFDNIELIFGSSDEVTLIHPQAFARVIGHTKYLDYFEPFEYMSYGKNVFDDGVSSIYELKLR